MDIIESTAIVVNDPTTNERDQRADDRQLLGYLPQAYIPRACLPMLQTWALQQLVETGACVYYTDENGYQTWRLTEYGLQLRETTPKETA